MRSILHCDLNNFFASVEMINRPELRNVPMAVSGDANTRHGIILAKNDIAKKYGIYTPETVYSALKKCRNLVLIRPNLDEYNKYSKLVNEIYAKYTDKVEKFGIDESFLDVTESVSIFGTPEKIAYNIKEEIKEKYNLTISVGVSFNKSLAKLGSDMKKPDAITILSEETFKEKTENLPVNMLLYVGKNVYEKLLKMGIKTIGDLRNSNIYRLNKHLGKLGQQIYNYATGLDNEEVKKIGERSERKSISKGITFSSDINNYKELEEHMIKLLSDVSYSLRKKDMKCSVIGITLKDNLFVNTNRQKKIDYTNSFGYMCKNLQCLLNENYVEGVKIRAITVFASSLQNDKDNVQMDLFTNVEEKKTNEKYEKAEKALDQLREKFGNTKIDFGNVKKE